MNKIVDLEKSHPIAIEKYYSGEKYEISLFEDFITYGYGKLSDYGFWEYDLYFHDDKYNS